MIISDFHTHTSFSSDSTAPVTDMIEKAIQLGLKTYCITDHMDYLYPHPESGSFVFDPDEYFKKLTMLKEVYEKEIDLCIGIELGLRNENDIKQKVKDYYSYLTSKYPFDFVLGSTHQLYHYDPYRKEFWDHRNVKDVLTYYFLSIAQNCADYSMFQICGHLDYIIRYIPDAIKDYAYADYQDVIDLALKAIIENQKGIECNTSGYKYGLNRPHPKFELLKRYRELGGELLTIGSDAHEPRHIATAFDTIVPILKNAGFRYYTTYKNQIPHFHKL